VIIFNLILGFPKVRILTLPMEEKMPVLVIVLVTFLLPIIISCAIYIKLIFIKKKIFQNKIAFSLEDNDAIRNDSSDLSHPNYKIVDGDNGKEVNSEDTKNENSKAVDVFSQQMVLVVSEIHNECELENKVTNESVNRDQQFHGNLTDSTFESKCDANNAFTEKSSLEQKPAILYQNTEKRKSLPNIEKGEHVKISLEKLNEIEFQNLEEIQNPKTSSENTGSATILSGNKINIVRNTRERETRWSSESYIAKIVRKDEEEQTRAQLSAARCQFHQHFLRTFFIRKSFWQPFSSYISAKKHFCTKNACVKC